MSRFLVAPEEVRDALLGANTVNGTETVSRLAHDLVCSESTIRRHLNVLIARGWVVERAPRVGSRAAVFRLTGEGRRASTENEGL